MDRVTLLLERWRQGDEEARELLFDQMYAQIKQRAVAVLGKQWKLPRIQPTELVNEAYFKLADLKHIEWQNRAHFLAMASTVMRQVLIDQHRHANADKRAHERVTLVTELLNNSTPEDTVDLDLIRLDDALQELQQISTEYARIVEMKFFGGMTHEEIGAVLNVSASTVKRNWRTARAWLENNLTDHDD